MRFRFDPTSTRSEGRFRLISPHEFEEGSLRRTEKWRGKTWKGVSFIVGKLAADETLAVHSIRFDRAVWSEAAAGAWWATHGDGFEKTWDERDWAEIRRRAKAQMHPPGATFAGTTESGEKVETAFTPTNILNWIEKTSTERVDSIIGFYLEKWRGVALAEFAAGTPAGKLAKKMQESDPTLSDVAARRQARTLTTAVYNYSKMERYAKDPAVLEFLFVAVMDKVTTPQCRHLNKKRFSKEEVADFLPPLHYNCRSAIRPVTVYDAKKEVEKYPKVDKNSEAFKNEALPGLERNKQFRTPEGFVKFTDRAYDQPESIKVNKKGADLLGESFKDALKRAAKRSTDEGGATTLLDLADKVSFEDETSKLQSMEWILDNVIDPDTDFGLPDQDLFDMVGTMLGKTDSYFREETFLKEGFPTKPAADTIKTPKVTIKVGPEEPAEPEPAPREQPVAPLFPLPLEPGKKVAPTEAPEEEPKPLEPRVVEPEKKAEPEDFLKILFAEDTLPAYPTPPEILTPKDLEPLIKPEPTVPETKPVKTDGATDGAEVTPGAAKALKTKTVKVYDEKSIEKFFANLPREQVTALKDTFDKFGLNYLNVVAADAGLLKASKSGASDLHVATAQAADVSTAMKKMPAIKGKVYTYYDFETPEEAAAFGALLEAGHVLPSFKTAWGSLAQVKHALDNHILKKPYQVVVETDNVTGVKVAPPEKGYGKLQFDAMMQKGAKVASTGEAPTQKQLDYLKAGDKVTFIKAAEQAPPGVQVKPGKIYTKKKDLTAPVVKPDAALDAALAKAVTGPKFKSTDEMVKASYDWAQNLTDSERAALQSWTGGGYRMMRAVMDGRIPRSSAPDVAAQIDILNRALDKAPLVHEDMTVKRGFQPDPAALAKFKKLKPGERVAFASIASTSISDGTADSFGGRGAGVKIIITNPRTFRYVEGASSYSSEREATARTGAVLEVENIEPWLYGGSKRGGVVIYCKEVLGQAPTAAVKFEG